MLFVVLTEVELCNGVCVGLPGLNVVGDAMSHLLIQVQCLAIF